MINMTMYKDFLDKVREGNVEMRYPMTPSKWLDTEPTYTDVLRVRMSCGGGIGGAQWYEYLCGVTFEDLICAERFIRMKNIDGKEMMVNVNNIVEARPFKIASARLYSKNPNFTKGEYTVRYLLDPKATAQLVNRF